MAVKRKKRVRGGATFSCMKCGGRTHVLTTRKKKDHEVVRDRMCMKCRNRFLTQEIHA